MWDICGQLQMPVAIHISDPAAFFLPTDRFNERYEDSQSSRLVVSRPRFSSNAELIEARNRVFARHPKTHFIGLHVGSFAEDLGNVSENLDHFPNLSVNIAARIGELGRQPRTARAFFEKYQDRILFGTDATPHGDDLPQQLFNDQLYEIYFRFLETSDEYFDYAPRESAPSRSLADLRHRSSRSNSAQGLQGECRARSRAFDHTFHSGVACSSGEGFGLEAERSPADLLIRRSKETRGTTRDRGKIPCPRIARSIAPRSGFQRLRIRPVACPSGRRTGTLH